jgi:hypothetical protein
MAAAAAAVGAAVLDAPRISCKRRCSKYSLEVIGAAAAAAAPWPLPLAAPTKCVGDAWWLDPMETLEREALYAAASDAALWLAAPWWLYVELREPPRTAAAALVAPVRLCATSDECCATAPTDAPDAMDRGGDDEHDESKTGRW